MRTDSSKIALRTLKNLLESAHPFELTVGTNKVSCTASRLPVPPWPAHAIGVTEEEDGPWPAGVSVECTWNEGRVVLIVEAYCTTHPRSRGSLYLRVGTDQKRQLIFVKLSSEFKDVEDGAIDQLGVRFYVTKAKLDVATQQAFNVAMRDTLAESQLPIVGKSRAELCRVEVPTGTLLPSAQHAFETLVHLALMKLDFLNYGGTAQRGKPLVDLRRWLSSEQLETLRRLAFDDAEEEIETDDGAENSGDALGEHQTPRGLPLNLIFYGPPGTGKTYHLTSKILPDFRRAATGEESLEELAGRLDWFEVVALAVADLGKVKVPALRQHPLVKAKHVTNPVKDLSARLWATLQTFTVENSTTVNYTKRSPEQYFDKSKESDWYLANQLPEELKAVATQLKHQSNPHVEDYTFITFHQAYSYEDFIEGIRPATDVDGSLAYSLEPGALVRAVLKALRLAGFQGTMDEFCTLSREQRERQFRGARHYALCIDEINRGNVARIFGELLTLVEEDKRLGAKNEVIVHLPYSKQRFGVPPNLHIIGTMNTADRSVDALDTALRRRFEFQELAPLPATLDFQIEGGIEPDKMLQAINRRIEKLYDRDHCLGHAYLYGLRENPTLDALKHVFRHKVLPLLQEYFFGDWGKIGLVLGKDFVRRRDLGPSPFADFEHEDHDALAERASWELSDLDKLSNEAFQRIYRNA
jgi:hypothetical protein